MNLTRLVLATANAGKVSEFRRALSGSGPGVAAQKTREPAGQGLTCGFVVARGGVEPPTFRFSVGRSYQLSYLARALGAATWLGDCAACSATPTGLEPATSAVTGRRANQLRYGALVVKAMRIPNGIRTRTTAVKGRGPGPLDDGDPTSPGIHVAQSSARNRRSPFGPR